MKNSIFSLKNLALVMIATGFAGIIFIFWPIVSQEIRYQFIQIRPKGQVQGVRRDQEFVSFGEILKLPPALKTASINNTNAIVIDKIGVSVPIIWDISVNDKQQYMETLKYGVAHAEGTQRPSEQKGNTYIFAHSTINPLEIEKYSASFTLLHRLEKGDRITAFSNQKRYDYVVENKEVVSGFNTEPLTRTPEYPMLTLQTCDPPGIPLNRLIITARLVEVY